MITRCQNCGSVMPEAGNRCLNCGAAVGDPNPAYPMKWFKILTRFALTVAGMLMLLLGMLDLMGLPYSMQGYDTSLLYTKIPLLFMVDTIYGVLCCILGVMYFITCTKLIRFRKSGPVLLYITYGLNILFPVIYAAVTRYYVAPIGSPLLGLTEIGELVGMLAGIALNVVYFTKRKHMFS